jgi:hypothetical protein
MSDKVTLKLSNKQANLLLQSVLFSCTSDITVDWDSAELRELADLSKTIEKQIDDIDLSNLQAYTFRDNENSKYVFEEEWTEDILSHFKDNIKIVDMTNEIHSTLK